MTDIYNCATRGHLKRQMHSCLTPSMRDACWGWNGTALNFKPLRQMYLICLVCADSFLHAVASPCHSFVTTCGGRGAASRVRFGECVLLLKLYSSRLWLHPVTAL